MRMGRVVLGIAPQGDLAQASWDSPQAAKSAMSIGRNGIGSRGAGAVLDHGHASRAATVSPSLQLKLAPLSAEPEAR